MSKEVDIDDERRVSWPQRHHQHQNHHIPFVRPLGDLNLQPQPLQPVASTQQSNTHHHQLSIPPPPPPPPPPPISQQQSSTIFGYPIPPQDQQLPPSTTSTAATAAATAAAHYICYSSTGYPETYSVLPVGHGNFLKVYHSIDSERPQIICNNYELFSNNLITQQSQVFQAEPLHESDSPIQTVDESILVDGMPYSVPVHPPGFKVTEVAANATNMIINKLVNNWSPNLTGNYSQFQDQVSTSSPIATRSDPGSSENFYKVPTSTLSTSEDQPINNAHKYTQNSEINNYVIKTNGNFGKNNPSPELKKRIVAEVKPMRMSYSDVLSKVNNKTAVGTPNEASANQRRASQLQNAKSPSSSSSKLINDNKTAKFGSGISLNERKVSPMSTAVDDKKKNDSQTNGNGNGNGNANRKQNEQQQSTSTLNSITNIGGLKKTGDKKGSLTPRENKENIQNFLSSQKINKNTKKIADKPYNRQTASAPGTDITDDENMKYSKRDLDSNKTSSKTSFSKDVPNEKEPFYNITTKNDGQFERYQKINTSQSQQNNSQQSGGGNNSSSNNNNKKSRTTNRSTTQSNSKTIYRFDKQQRSGNNNNNNNNNRGLKKKSSSKDKYEMLEKFFTKILPQYTMQILTWLFCLVYDIIVIGFGIAYDRLSQVYVSGSSYILILRRDLKSSSNKPSIWIQNLLKKINGKFRKNSKWAFWRRFFKKKPITNAGESQKTGRLPQTGEEAMYSLLNCKGKDAYSVLGVPENSSQEQIRKHYKKIAVLVHPDKNKQPGAEEAFKVLQRAFELIGEPENRMAYDQSLLKAYHAEKDWTELHDLLSQLQTKISEAANTIKCSSCGLRHPRKLTDRPHYAARECGSCKIRHSAREGDIWAETNWLRLQWKYLALMEGKVYDITKWANCQKGALSYLQPNSHIVQYRIVRGGQQQQQQQQHQQQHQQQQQQQQNQHHQQQQQQKQPQNTQPPSGATFDEFLDNLYSGQNHRHGQTGQNASARRRARRN